MRKAPPRKRPAIAILTDFGYRDHYVGVMKGVIARIAPAAPIIDLTHGIPSQQVAAGAIALAQSLRFFPEDTVFLAVVDPGVGAARLPIAIATHAGACFVGPDNGLLWPAAQEAGIKQIVELRDRRYRLPNPSSTFHGRDIFAPAAAWIARGTPLGSLGPQLDRMVELKPASGVIETTDGLEGRVIYVDGFGNLITNLTRSRIDQFAVSRAAGRLTVQIQQTEAIALSRTYSDAPPGRLVALYSSFDALEIAVRDGDAAGKLGAAAGFTVRIGIDGNRERS